MSEGEARDRLQIDPACTPTADQRQSDMVVFPARPGDQRVVRGDWVFYVVAVPRGRRFLGSGSGSGTGAGAGLGEGDDVVASLVIASLRAIVWPVLRLGRARRRPARWKVGVIRVPDPSTWKVDRHRVVHRIVLTPGEEPMPALAEMRDRVRAGEFDAP